MIIRHIAPIVFQSENIDFSECFGDRSSLSNCPDWSNSSIFGWKQYIHIIKSDPHREMDHLAQHSELRKDNRSPELSHALSIHLAAYLHAPVRLNWHYLRKGFKIDFLQQIAETVTKLSFWFILKECSDWAGFLCWFVTSLTLILLPMPVARIIVNRDVLKLVHYFNSSVRCDFAPSMSQSKNDASDWMRCSTASIKWYLSTEIGLSRFWKSI